MASPIVRGVAPRTGAVATATAVAPINQEERDAIRQALTNRFQAIKLGLVGDGTKLNQEAAQRALASAFPNEINWGISEWANPRNEEDGEAQAVVVQSCLDSLVAKVLPTTKKELAERFTRDAKKAQPQFDDTRKIEFSAEGERVLNLSCRLPRIKADFLSDEESAIDELMELVPVGDAPKHGVEVSFLTSNRYFSVRIKSE